MLPFLTAFIDFNSSPETYRQYDKMSARELFRRFGVSERCYNEFLKPTLLVGLFAPPEEISAAGAALHGISALHNHGCLSAFFCFSIPFINTTSVAAMLDGCPSSCAGCALAQVVPWRLGVQVSQQLCGTCSSPTSSATLPVCVVYVFHRC